MKYRVVFVLCYLLFLNACSSLNSREMDEETKRKVSTAKINAQLGIAYLDQNNVQRARQKILLAMNQAPNIPEPWYAMGYFLETTGSKTAAADYYVKAINVDPTRGDSRNNYGTFLCRSGHYHEAISQFMAAVRDTNYLSPAAAYENAGLCALKIPNNKLALQYFKQALREEPGRPESLLKVADLDYRRGRVFSAKATLSQYFFLGAQSREALNLQGRINKYVERDHQRRLDEITKMQLLARRKHADPYNSFARLKESVKQKLAVSKSPKQVVAMPVAANQMAMKHSDDVINVLQKTRLNQERKGIKETKAKTLALNQPKPVKLKVINTAPKRLKTTEKHTLLSKQTKSSDKLSKHLAAKQPKLGASKMIAKKEKSNQANLASNNKKEKEAKKPAHLRA